MMWGALVLISLIVCFTVDDILEKYFEAKYKTKRYQCQRCSWKEYDDDDDEIVK